MGSAGDGMKSLIPPVSSPKLASPIPTYLTILNVVPVVNVLEVDEWRTPAEDTGGEQPLCV